MTNDPGHSAPSRKPHARYNSLRCKLGSSYPTSTREVERRTTLRGCRTALKQARGIQPAQQAGSPKPLGLRAILPHQSSGQFNSPKENLQRTWEVPLVRRDLPDSSRVYPTCQVVFSIQFLGDRTTNPPATDVAASEGSQQANSPASRHPTDRSFPRLGSPPSAIATW